jgi:hypothetical protein
MIRNVVSGVAVAVFMLLTVPTFSSAIQLPDDPSVLGERVNRIASIMCNGDPDCQQEVRAAANSCIQTTGNATGLGIADCIISRVDSVDLAPQRDRLIQEIESAFGIASEVENQDDPGAVACDSTILGFPAWHNGLQCDEFGPSINKLNDVWVIVLNMISWMLGVAAYAAAVFIIWGGFKYIKSQGDPSAVATAKTTIFQAVGGLGIALISTALVYYVQGVIR